MPLRSAARRPLSVRPLPARPMIVRPAGLLSARAARRTALPLALALAAGATGCRSASGPLETLSSARVSAAAAMSGARDAVLSPIRAKAAPCDGNACAAVADPFLAAELALAGDGGDAAEGGAAGPRFADGFDAKLVALRRQVGAGETVAASGESDAGADDAADAPDGAALATALEDAAPPADLAAAPTGPDDLFADAPAAPSGGLEPVGAPFADSAGVVPQLAEAPPAFGGGLGQAWEEGGEGVVQTAGTQPDGGFNPFDGLDPAANKADAGALAAAPLPETAAAPNPSGPPKSVGSVSANLGTAPQVTARDVAALDPFGDDSFDGDPFSNPPAGAPTVAAANAPEMSFGRPPLPPARGDRAAALPPAAADLDRIASDPALAALAAPGDGSTGANPRAPRAEAGDPSFPAEPALSSAGGADEVTGADPALAALMAPMPPRVADLGGEPGGEADAPRIARSAPTMPSSAAAAPPVAPPVAPQGVPPADLALSLNEEPPTMRTAARPTIAAPARAAGGVELDAPAMAPAATAATASPAAPLTAGLGIGCFLLVGLSLWRRRGGLV